MTSPGVCPFCGVMAPFPHLSGCRRNSSAADTRTTRQKIEDMAARGTPGEAASARAALARLDAREARERAAAAAVAPRVSREQALRHRYTTRSTASGAPTVVFSVRVRRTPAFDEAMAEMSRTMESMTRDVGDALAQAVKASMYATGLSEAEVRARTKNPKPLDR